MKRIERGFTLIEVLAALFIISIIALASSQIVTNAANIREIKNINEDLNLCASNTAKLIQIDSLQSNMGESTVGNKTCQWEVEMVATEIKDFFRYNIQVNIGKHRFTMSHFKGVGVGGGGL